MNFSRLLLALFILSSQIHCFADSHKANRENVNLYTPLNAKKRHKDKNKDKTPPPLPRMPWEMVRQIFGDIDPVAELQKIVDFTTAGSHLAQEKEVSVTRTFINSSEVAVSLKEAAQLYDNAAKNTLDLLRSSNCLPYATELELSIHKKAQNFQNEANRCRNEANTWPAKVLAAKKECMDEIDRLKNECILYEKQGMWHTCRNTYKQIASILENIYEGQNDHIELISCLKKIGELDITLENQRFSHEPSKISQEEFNDRESLLRSDFFSLSAFNEVTPISAIALDGQSSSLFTQQYYRYLIQKDTKATTLRIKVLENDTEIYEESIEIPLEGDSWEHYLVSDEMLFIPKTNLSTIFGLDLRFRVVLDSYYNFSLVIGQKGSDTKYKFSFILDDEPLYDIFFISPPPWQLEALRKPLLLQTQVPVVQPSLLEFTPAIDDGSRNYLDTISYPVIDQFIKEMKNDPLALAQYVQNEIELVDPFLMREDQVFKAPSIHRSPLRTFLENQGSPWEQCALLVYLLKHAGYQAQYIEGTCSLPARYVEKLLFLQLPEEEEISLDYPGVLFYDGQNWHPLFPWMKEIDMIEGYDLYSLLPDEYGNAERWLKHYLSNDENILKHIGPDGDDTVGVLFVRFVEEHLRKQGLSIQDVGTHRRIHKKQFNHLADFPRPRMEGDVKCNVSLFSTNNTFAQIKIKCYSEQNPTLRWESPAFSLLELSCGTFDIHFSPNDKNGHLLHFNFTEASTKELSILPLGANDQTIKIEVLYYTSFGNKEKVHESKETFTIAKGTCAALCFHSGNSNAKITTMFADQLNNSTSPQQKLHALFAFIGASYFEKCSQASKILATLHKVSPTTYFSIGLSKLSPDYSSVNDLRFPQVDMKNNTYHKNHHKHPFSLYQEVKSALKQYQILSIADSSANEHQVLREIYQDPHAISTVKLLQIAHRGHRKKGISGPGFLFFTNKSFELADTNPELARLLYFSHMDKIDLSLIKKATNPLWDSLRSLFKISDPNFSYAFMTPGIISSLDGYGLTPPSYTGVGVLALSSTGNAAWITSGSSIMNGGFGSRLTDNFMHTINNPDWKLVSNGNKYSFLTSKDANIFKGNTSDQLTKIDRSYTFKLNNAEDQSYIGWNGSAWKVPTAATIKADVRQGFKSPFDLVADPVDVISGAFYIDEIDLTLPGAFPLEIRRNYNSQNTLPGVFGFGWKLNLNPILYQEEDKLFASEQDGTVIVYRRAENLNRWIVLPEDNPQLKNYNLKGIGGTSNPFHAFIEKDTDYILHGTDGSKRVFHNMLLTTWFDHAGNTLKFSYKNEQLQQIESSSGGLICFEYNYGGKISEAYTKDGRRINYTYDFQGNLASVTLPNNAITAYEYDNSHRIIRETKPHGRVLENIYKNDKVVEQRSPVGQQQHIVTSATFEYSEGKTIVTDGTGAQTEYKIYNNQIYKITDTQGYQTLQSWFIDENSFFDPESEMVLPCNSPGAYMRSMKSSKDKRGLTTDYQYDNRGNPQEISISGKDLTGNGEKSISKTFTYDANNICIGEETLNTKSITTYDSALSFLPTRVEKYIDDVLISFIDLEYTQNGLIKKNNHCGAITDWEYDVRDFPIKKIQQSGTEDPDVVTSYLFNDQGQCVDILTSDAIEHNEYDIMGNKCCCTISLPSGKIISKTYAGYDLNNALTWKQGDDINDSIFFDYNSAGLLKASQKNLSQSNGTSIIPAGVAYTLYEYDVCGRLIEKVDPLGNCTYCNNDDLGRVISTTKNGLTTRFSYEAGGLVASITSPGGATTSRSYTTNGLIKSETNPDGTQSFCTYDLFGRQIKIVNNDLTSTIIYNDAAFEEIRSVG
ncbi:MAG TPA: DUF6531 domain-containing protein, partial [Parachlamydiaceae bacterium]|nr:DUF6531 domain-containing protein [Parachlamydiaceae bacterium]